MGTNAAGFTPNIASQIAKVNQKTNPNNSQAPASSGPRADAFSRATPAPATTAVATPGSAPAAPVGGTTAPAAQAPAAPQAMPIAVHPGAMAAIMMNSGVASQAVSASGIGESKDKNKDETNKAINRAKEIGDKSGLGLQDQNSSVGAEAAEGGTGGANAANAPAA